MTRKNNIKKFLWNLFFILVFVAGSLILVFAGKLAYEKLYKKKSNIGFIQDRLLADVKQVNILIEATQKIPRELAQILEIHKVNTEEMNILLESVMFNNPEIFGSAIAFEPHQFCNDSLYYATYTYRSGDSVIHSNLNSPEYNYFFKDWYLIPKTSKKATWSEPYHDVGGGNLLMSTYSVPFYHFDGYDEKINGIITVDVTVEKLTRAVKAIGKFYNGCAILISENGTIIAAPFEDWIYNETIYTLASEINLPVLREIGRELKNGKTGIKYMGQFKPYQKTVAFYTIIPSNKWGLILFIPETELYK
jgi:phosphoserine phosphatase RsbU/P